MYQLPREITSLNSEHGKDASISFETQEKPMRVRLSYNHSWPGDRGAGNLARQTNVFLSLPGTETLFLQYDRKVTISSMQARQGIFEGNHINCRHPLHYDNEYPHFS